MFINILLFFSGTLRVWELERENRKIKPTDVTMGQIKRIVKCIQVCISRIIEKQIGIKTEKIILYK